MGSNNSLYIYPRALKLSVKVSMFVPGTNCWVVRYIDVSDTNSSRILIVNTTWNYGGMRQSNVRPF